ncbi:MAG: hypothetical protein Q9226_004687 [Calogaya cf. arnoldii]
MQHLSFLPQKEIPYLGGPVYAGEGLRPFVKRHGLTPFLLHKINFKDRSPRSKFAFIQSLLNIAIVVEFLRIRNVDVNHNTFCRDDSVLDTTKLPVLMETMAKNTAPELPKVRLSKEEEAFRVYEIFDLIRDCYAGDILQNMEDEALAISCMVSTLAELVRLPDFFDILPPDKALRFYGSTNQHLQPIEILLQAGWCPRQVAELYNATNPISLYYITTLKRNRIVGNHGSCTTSKLSENHALVKCKDGLINVTQTFLQANLTGAPDTCAEYCFSPDLPGFTESRNPRAELFRSNRYKVYFTLRVPEQLGQNTVFCDSEKGAGPLDYFCNVIQQTSNLSTARAEDETPCLASAMDQESGPLAALAPKDRMEKFLSQIGTLPASILFGEGPRSGQPALGWAPASFLIDHRWPKIEPHKHPVGHYHTILEFGGIKGFDIVLGGYVLTKHATRILRRAAFKLPGLSAPVRCLKYVNKLEDPRGWWLDWFRGRCEEDREESFLPEELPSQLRLIMFYESLLHHGILVEYLESNAGVEHVRFIARMDVTEHYFSDNISHFMTWNYVGLDWEEKGRLVYAEPIQRQRWFIT